MALDRRRSFAFPPEKQDQLQAERIREHLKQLGFSTQLNRDVLHQLSSGIGGDPTGLVWYPGYYEKWFGSTIGYKEHENWIGYDDKLGPISISMIYEDVAAEIPKSSSSLSLNSNPDDSTKIQKSAKQMIRALVRTPLGFHGVLLDAADIFEAMSGGGHKRGFSATKKLTLNPGKSPKEVTLEKILKAYLDRCRKVSDSGVNLSRVSTTSLGTLASSHSQTSSFFNLNSDEGSTKGLKERSTSDLSQASRHFYQSTLKRWGSVKGAEFFNKISIPNIIASLIEVPFPSMCRELHNLEKPSQSIVHVVDVVLMCGLKTTEQLTMWEQFLSQLGTPVKLSHAISPAYIPVCNETQDSEKYAEQRKYVMAEFLDTERRYLEHLQLIESVFIEPLADENIISKTEKNCAFPKVQDMIPVHEQLLKALESTLSANAPAIGTEMLPFVPRFMIYKKYINAHQASVSTVKELLAKNSTFRFFIQSGEKDPRCGKLKIEDLLIEPVQRLPRYGLLLKELLKCTPVSDPDHVNLKSAYTEFQKLNSQMNESLKNEQSQIMMFELKKQIENCPDDIIKQNRRFIQKFEATEIDPSSGKETRQVIIYLFNDALLLVKKSKATKIMGSNKVVEKYIGCYDLLKTELISLIDRGFQESFQIEIFINEKRQGPIKLNDLPSKKLSKEGRPKTAEEDEQRVIHAFKAAAHQDFVVAYRKTKEEANPRNSLIQADIYRQWSESNEDIEYRVYSQLQDYLKAPELSKMLVMYVDDEEIKKMKTPTYTIQGPLMSCFIIGKSKQYRTFFGGVSAVGANCVQETANKDDEHDKEEWWRRVEDGFSPFFQQKVLSLSRALLQYDDNYQDTRRTEVRVNLVALVLDFLRSQSTPLATNILKNSPLKLSRTNTVKKSSGDLSRRGSKNSVHSIQDSGISLPDGISVSSSQLSIIPAEKPVIIGNSSPNADVESLRGNLPPHAVTDQSPATPTRHPQSNAKVKRRPSIMQLMHKISGDKALDDSCVNFKNMDRFQDSLLHIVNTLAYFVETNSHDVTIYQHEVAEKQMEGLFNIFKSKPDLVGEYLSSFDTAVVASALRIWVSKSIPYLLSEKIFKKFFSAIESSSERVVDLLEHIFCDKAPAASYEILEALVNHWSRMIEKLDDEKTAAIEILAKSWSMTFMFHGYSQARSAKLISILIVNQNDIFTGTRRDPDSPKKQQHTPNNLKTPPRQRRSTVIASMSLDNLLSVKLPPVSPSHHVARRCSDMADSITILSRIEESPSGRTSRASSAASTPKVGRKSPSGSLLIPRVPVKAVSVATPEPPQIVDRPASAMDTPGNERRQPSSGLYSGHRQKSREMLEKEFQDLSLSENAAPAGRRSVSLPVMSEVFQQTLRKLKEKHDKLNTSPKKEDGRLQKELSCLRNQVSSLKKALHAELSRKSSSPAPSEHIQPKIPAVPGDFPFNQEQFVAEFEQHLERIQGIYEQQADADHDQQAATDFQAELQKLSDAYRDAEQEIVELRTRVQELELRNRQLMELAKLDEHEWKRSGADLLIRERDVYKMKLEAILNARK